MLHETQRTSAPSSVSVSMSTRRLNRHVQAAHDPSRRRAASSAVLLPQGHQTGHFLLGQAHFLAAKIGEREIFYLVPARGLGMVWRQSEWVLMFLDDSRHGAWSPLCKSHYSATFRVAFSPVATNNPGPFTRRQARARRFRSSEASLGQHPAHVLVGKPEPYMSHLLAIASVVRKHVTHDDASARPQRPGLLSDRAFRAPACDASTSINTAMSRSSSIGNASSSPRRIDVVQTGEPFRLPAAWRPELSHGNDARHEGSQRGADLPVRIPNLRLRHLRRASAPIAAR